MVPNLGKNHSQTFVCRESPFVPLMSIRITKKPLVLMESRPLLREMI